MNTNPEAARQDIPTISVHRFATFAELVDWFCTQQAELRSRLAQAGGRDNDGHGDVADRGAHEGA